MCPCGIVTSLKFNLRAESPRDCMDLLMSWQHIPNIVIYDFVWGPATHGNIRFPRALSFSPHEGRLLSPTAENIQRDNYLAIKWGLHVCQPVLYKCFQSVWAITTSKKKLNLYDHVGSSKTTELHLQAKKKKSPTKKTWALLTHKSLWFTDPVHSKSQLAVCKAIGPDNGWHSGFVKDQRCNYQYDWSKYQANSYEVMQHTIFVF